MTAPTFDHDAIVERLRHTPLFGSLSPADLDSLVGMGEVLQLGPGELLIREGDAADALYVVLEGDFQVTKLAGTSEIPIDRVGPGSLQGDIATLEGGRRLASVRALDDAVAFKIPVSALRTLMASGPDVAVAIIGTAFQRLRGMEASLRERDKLAGLGQLAAGLAHELNNPAAAAGRSVASLAAAVTRLEALPRPVRVPASPGIAPPVTALDRSERVAEVAEIAGDEAAGALVAAGWSGAELARHPPEAVAWIAAHAQVHELLGELEMAVRRVSEIVGAVKGYTFLDEAPVQVIDVRQGLDETLIILRHRLRDGITVERDYSANCPLIEAYGSELNQVWTNLIDNAVDAMSGSGQLTLRVLTDTDTGGACVSVCDTGPGIPPDVRARLFEPFFTTKPPGKGTGLGLHIAHTVVARHGGRIDVASEAGGTCFVVTLPVRLPATS